MSQRKKNKGDVEGHCLEGVAKVAQGKRTVGKAWVAQPGSSSGTTSII